MIVDGADAEAIIVGGRIRRRRKRADCGCRSLRRRRRNSGIFVIGTWRRRCFGRGQRNRRHNRSLRSRAVLRAGASKREAESQERRASHLHPSTALVHRLAARLIAPRRAPEYQDSHGRQSAASGPRSLVLPDGQNTPALGQLPLFKRFAFTEILFCRTTLAIPARHKGRFAIVTDVGWDAVAATASSRQVGCRAGNRERRLARYDTALTASRFGLDGERTPAIEDCERGCARTEKSCGPDARGLCVKSCSDVSCPTGHAHRSSAWRRGQ